MADKLAEKLAAAELEIEAQKDYIRELELRKAQYDSILENMQELVERSGPDYSLRYVNDAFTKLYRMQPEEMLGRNTMDLVHEDDWPAIDEMMKGVSPENPHYRYEYRIQHKDGSIIWVESAGRGFYDEDGNVLEYQDVGRDITHFKNLQGQLEAEVRRQTEELTKVNHYLQSILSTIAEGIVVIDDVGDCVFLNYGPGRLWENSSSEIASFFRQMLLTGSPPVLAKLVRKQRGFENMEMHCPTAGGDISFIVSGIPLPGEGGGPMKAILVMRPVSQVHKMVNVFSGTQSRFQFRDIVTNSTVLQNVIQLAKQAANSEANILIEGESGTGKEMFAQSIHAKSPRRRGPFVAINCGAIPRELVASELFGYDEGAFTGAKKGGKPGKFELAAGGTLFLDEIADMPMEQQTSLLRVLQERTITRVGGSREIPVDVRVICATNRTLLREVMDKNFRQDLYYRLNVINLMIPPLRERKEDILLLFHNLMHTSGRAVTLEEIDADVLHALVSYNWPGNVRELQNVVERMLYLAEDGPISMQSLPRHLTGLPRPPALPTLSKGDEISSSPALPKPHAVEEIRNRKREELLERERHLLFSHLQAAGGNISAAAKAMGVSRSTFYRKMRQYQREE